VITVTERRRAQLVGFLVAHLPVERLDDDEDLFAGGYVNSMFALELVVFVETAFGVTIESADLELDNFRSVRSMLALLERKLGG
jgi:methoxymalonate biosynthesis acyl carrier protein